MDYEYDVFVSYSRDFPYGKWVREIFLPLFQGFLKGALNKEPKLYIDEKIPTGNEWTEDLKNALARSRCLVGIWSPHYFISKWCKSECFVMLHRERTLNFRSLENPDGLIVPVTIQDGDIFPEYAKKIQSAPWHRFARDGNGFKETRRYVEFQDEMLDWVEDVARAIKSAPPWNPEWLSDDLFNKVIPKWVENSKIDTITVEDYKFNRPSLE